MYIKELSMENFRGFSTKTTIEFQKGINVLIGANNSGKTTIIKALELLFSSDVCKSLKIEDFNHNIAIDNIKDAPPKIIISAKLIEEDSEDKYSNDLIMVASWLTKIDKPYEAEITYEFSLPEKEYVNYKSEMNQIESHDIDMFWKEIETDFLRKYTYKVFVGNPEYRISIDNDSIRKFDFQFLNAIRDVERDLFTGKNALLKEVIDFFIDYEIKIDQSIKVDEKKKLIQEKKKAFSSESQKLIESLQKRMCSGKKEMLKYVEETGADFDNMKPTFDGKILDTELYSALKLVVENETGIKLPATRNGLGYNNLIYISLLLAKMQKNSSVEYLGSNSKVFSILAFEEPEAHLHPNMQYKLLKFLEKNRTHEVRQIFITTHSPNITAAVNLNSIIVLSKKNSLITVSYPGRVFSDSGEDMKSKKYIERFLDVTKADMFFANNIIFVEGLAEQMLLPSFAEAEKLSLIDNHISIINVNGRYFEYFLKLFDTKNNKYAISKKVVCITDLDPVMKLKKNTDENSTDENSSWKSCFPFMLDIDKSKYEYRKSSNKLTSLYQERNDEDIIRVYTQKQGSTFEYELILENYSCEDIITQSVSNSIEIKKIMNLIKEDMSQKELEELIKIIRKGEFKELASQYSNMGNDEPFVKAKHIVAARYLKSIKKGEIAQELATVISNNIEKEVGERFSFNVPSYIKEALKWICH
ncbi:ATP-dependent nuclease [Clostridium senegalense]|uniref:AAA family ATPase n=1 Tax=Clostridium senegalense TaxID=1465809 RepID=A0A6M0H4M0_9CLOT|nr:AAA family ATPase [Clostridium senegalense]NEU05184.1 AAA family ATPase [Clostridium senegalense]